MSKYIQNLIEQGENQMLDFKFEISDARKIARTLVAFSNTDGGKLLIGVKDQPGIIIVVEPLQCVLPGFLNEGRYVRIDGERHGTLLFCTLAR